MYLLFFVILSTKYLSEYVFLKIEFVQLRVLGYPVICGITLMWKYMGGNNDSSKYVPTRVLYKNIVMSKYTQNVQIHNIVHNYCIRAVC